jgi:tetratricopeptide (TPR) repeat protein
MANYARILLQLGRKNEAIRTLEASLTPDTNAPRARAWLARTYRGSGQSDRALEHFQLLVSKDPSEIGVRYELASVLASLSRYQESAIQLEALLARDPNHTMALNDLGAIRLMQGNPEEAVRWLRKAAALQPESDTIQKNLATALKAKHHREKQAGGSRE